ncbi:MAG: hypothetical protein ABIP51_01105 [Bacteroidia bacterium]
METSLRDFIVFIFAVFAVIGGVSLFNHFDNHNHAILSAVKDLTKAIEELKLSSDSLHGDVEDVINELENY